MSIQTEITRLSGNVQAALTAIGEKGVSVPSGAKSDDLASLIAQVEAGIDTSDATAAAGDILSGKTAYVDGEKITGTIAAKTSSNVTASGKTVTVPAGYYASQVSKSVSTATQATPGISVSTAGLITASATQSAGYVSSGTKSSTKQLTVQAAKTVTPSTSEQTAVASGVYTTGAVKVAAMPTATQATPAITVDASTGLITASATQTAGYVSAGTKSAAEQLTTQAAKTVTPSASVQTAVASGVYTTGEVKVAAVPTETKSATPGSSAQTITPSSGKFLSQVDIAAVPSTFKDMGTNVEYVVFSEATPTEDTAQLVFSVEGITVYDYPFAIVYVPNDHWNELAKNQLGMIISYSLVGGQIFKAATLTTGGVSLLCAWTGSNATIYPATNKSFRAITTEDHLFAANVTYKLMAMKLTDIQRL